MDEQSLQRPIQYIKGVGPKLAKTIEKLGVFTISDLLFYFPRDYDDRRTLPTIASLKASQVAGIVGIITHVQEKQTPKQNLIKAIVRDRSGVLEAVWFNQPYLKSVIKPGKRVYLKGKADWSVFNPELLQFAVQEMEVLAPEDNANQIQPIYRLSQGVYPLKFRGILKDALPFLKAIPETIPADICTRYQLTPLSEAIKILHFPQDAHQFEKARYRIVFEEFFSFQLALGVKRKIQKRATNPFQFAFPSEAVRNFHRLLPYKLTDSQQSAIADIQTDLMGKTVMNRLIQGDVGAGKTDVAISALLMALEAGYKAALLAPTEVLADQHFFKLQNLVASFSSHFDFPIEVVFLKGKLTPKQKAVAIKRLADPKPCLVVGTHALFEETVAMPQLALAVIDEQHRFGVAERNSLQRKAPHLHCLYMTATPIPRSLLLTCFGDLDKSIMSTLPAGRKPIKTYFFRENSLSKVFGFCQNEIAKGHQIYMVYPLIEDSEKLDLKSAEEGCFKLKEQVFPQFNIGLMHGRLKKDEKADVMMRFKTGETQILVSTTVIEVGVDVPNATVMIIMNAERFGLSQLHQLRGRVGRGGDTSYCFLIGSPQSSDSNDRIRAMLSTTDGFKIAEFDLKIRGPGDVLGTRQSGIPSFKLGDISKDEPILMDARTAAKTLLEHDPQLLRYPLLKSSMKNRFGTMMGVELN